MAEDPQKTEAKAEEKKKARPKVQKAKEEPKKAEARKAEAPKEAPTAERRPEVLRTEVVMSAPEAKPEVRPEPKAEKGRKTKAKPKRPATKAFVARGKRKESVARASIIAGKGMLRINSQNISSIPNSYIREIIREPLRYVGPEANGVDISVNVEGGGAMGQAQAARTAIANALVLYFEDMNLRDKFIGIDRFLVIEDTRRVEPKKFRGPKARARFQKSYR